MSKIRILLADDHAVVREGLKTLIRAQRDMTVVGEADDGQSAVQLAAELKPDVVVIDVSMPNMNGAMAAQQLKKNQPDIKIIALTVHEDRSYLERLLGAGASGYVLKRAAPQDLIKALRAVAAGGIYLDPQVAGTVVESFVGGRRTVKPLSTGQLTERETGVAKLVARGYTNKEISTQLGVSVKTVETHKAHCMEKLRLRSRAELVRYACDRGWLQSNR
jgi:DNA-binding NarL/FixJ family response regulator